MGKFRKHTLEEKRKLRNDRQKRKRRQRAELKLQTIKAEASRRHEEQIKLTDKFRETARQFCRKWKSKCEENLKLKELLNRNQKKVRNRRAVIGLIDMIFKTFIQ